MALRWQMNTRVTLQHYGISLVTVPGKYWPGRNQTQILTPTQRLLRPEHYLAKNHCLVGGAVTVFSHSAVALTLFYLFQRLCFIFHHYLYCPSCTAPLAWQTANTEVPRAARQPRRRPAAAQRDTTSPHHRQQTTENHRQLRQTSQDHAGLNTATTRCSTHLSDVTH